MRERERVNSTSPQPIGASPRSEQNLLATRSILPNAAHFTYLQICPSNNSNTPTNKNRYNRPSPWPLQPPHSSLPLAHRMGKIGSTSQLLCPRRSVLHLRAPRGLQQLPTMVTVLRAPRWQRLHRQQVCATATVGRAAAAAAPAPASTSTDAGPFVCLPEDFKLLPGEVSTIDRVGKNLPADVFRCFGCSKPECQVGGGTCCSCRRTRAGGLVGAALPCMSGTCPRV